jgi:TPP-dependent trihydroxycyclohexane-1,2-dione (THcHDO) dehydratase
MAHLMMNSEIATSVMLGRLGIVVLTCGFGCIDRLQRSCGIGRSTIFSGHDASDAADDRSRDAAALGPWPSR